MKNQKGFLLPIIIAVVVVIVLTAGGYFAYKQYSVPKPIACTEEAKLCPDGSSVSRTGLNCEFAECPAVVDQTADWKTYTNKDYRFEVKYPDFIKPKEGACPSICDPNDLSAEIDFVDKRMDEDIQRANLATNYFHIKILVPAEFFGGELKQIISQQLSEFVKYLWNYNKNSKSKPIVGDINKVKIGEEIAYTFSLSNTMSFPWEGAVVSEKINFLFFSDKNNTYKGIITFGDEHKTIIDQMLSTFKFINSTTDQTASQTLKINDVDYNFEFTKDSIKIFDKNKIFLQEIKIGTNEMDMAKFDLKNYKHSIVTANDDINFDGYKDLSVEIGNGYMGVNFFYNFYLFNPQDKKFKEISDLISVCNPNIQSEKKQILANCKSGPTYCERIYQFDGSRYKIISSPQNIKDFCD